jgi:hypothetical protein
MITGRFSGAGTTTVRVRSGQGSTTEIPVNLNESTATRPAIALAWARMKLSTLAAAAPENRDSTRSIRQLALEYGLLSEYTAFVLVDSRSPPAHRQHPTRRGG